MIFQYQIEKIDALVSKFFSSETDYLDQEIAKFAALQKQHDETQARLEELRVKKESQRQEIEQLEQSAELERRNEAALLEEIASFRAQIDSAEADLAKANDKIQTLTTEIERETQRKRKEQADADNRLREAAEQLRQERDRIVAAHAQNKERFAEVEREIRAGEEPLHAKRGSVSDLEKQLKSLNLESFSQPSRIVPGSDVALGEFYRRGPRGSVQGTSSLIV